MLNKSKFAELAGVSPGAISQAVKASLKPALVGRRIDETHDVAVAYLQKHAAPIPSEPATGIDPLYEQAVASGKRTANALRKELGVGSVRANKIVAMMKAAGITATPPGAVEKNLAQPDSRPPARTPSGQEAARTTKKDEALDKLVNGGDRLYDIPDDIQQFADMTLREIIARFGTDVAFCDWLKAVKNIEDINKKRLDNAEAEGKLVSRELVKVGIIDPIDSAHIKLLTDGSKTIAVRATAMHDSGRTVGEIEKFVAEQITSFIRPVKSKVARALRDA